MKVELISPQKRIFHSDDIILVQLPGIDGLFEILNRHAPMIALLKKGNIKVKDSQNKVTFFRIEKGFVEVKNNVVTIFSQ
ncbi:MAG TPA: F0F1 ATP synthase subunit epsilon [Bacteroidales bacterium]|jgi:F-type H+-transporting ATPase subunit epsilon|nr:F0F1 ATP synthase subunit epsilon [Bacteroidales bacterium]MDI9573104.1 F0F1 ATP synthase subunit epsilon [Bacteroidota bacterium]OQC60748.1 MAG: ATP synthase epsilon chain [Bacteroidetes bacterium ADurb.Bin012]NMD16087.1 F0F1 ATP synthase subunit epsilon [Bacteroidales bacterium]HNQ59847.1 F0F1 ATP synthase subunit epsilon [Bacteroidales bacterium]